MTALDVGYYASLSKTIYEISSHQPAGGADNEDGDRLEEHTHDDKGRRGSA